MAKLKPCPFCGGEAEYGQGRLYIDTTYVVRCKKCHCRTDLVIVNHPSLIWPIGASRPVLDESTRYTADQAKEIAAEAWNRRVKEANQ